MLYVCIFAFTGKLRLTDLCCIDYAETLSSYYTNNRRQARGTAIRLMGYFFYL